MRTPASRRPSGTHRMLALATAATVTCSIAVLTAPAALAVGGTGETASAAPLRLQSGTVDMKISLLGGLIDVPVHTTLVPSTDLKINQTTPPSGTFVSVPGQPALAGGVYSSGGTPIPMLSSCSPAVFAASPTWPVNAQVWGPSGLHYGADLLRFGVLGSCGGAAHAFTQRVQWGAGALPRRCWPRSLR